MPNLYNPRITPAGLRRCFWDPAYIASQSFCITSRLSDKEARQMADFEELRLFENLDILKKELQLEIDNDLLDGKTECLASVAVELDEKKAVDLYLASPKKFYFSGFKKAPKRFGFCYTQTRDGRPSKIAINRAEFLRK